MNPEGALCACMDEFLDFARVWGTIALFDVRVDRRYFHVRNIIVRALLCCMFCEPCRHHLSLGHRVIGDLLDTAEGRQSLVKWVVRTNHSALVVYTRSIVAVLVKTVRRRGARFYLVIIMSSSGLGLRRPRRMQIDLRMPAIYHVMDVLNLRGLWDCISTGDVSGGDDGRFPCVVIGDDNNDNVYGVNYFRVGWRKVPGSATAGLESPRRYICHDLEIVRVIHCFCSTWNVFIKMLFSTWIFCAMVVAEQNFTRRVQADKLF